jgi:hypothetical protein
MTAFNALALVGRALWAALLALVAFGVSRPEPKPVRVRARRTR